MSAKGVATMIVDVHTHVPTHPGAVPAGAERVDTIGRPDRPVKLTNSYADYFKAMEPVDRCISFGIASKPGGPPIYFDYGKNWNDATADLVKAGKGKVIGFMSIHPDDPRALDEMDRCVHDLKLRGIKLGANYQQYDPLGENACRVYERAQKLGLPILFHQGTSGMRMAPLRYAHPLAMDEIAMRFPELKVVMAHIGHPWHADCIVVIRKHPNVYADVSAQFYRPWSQYNGFRLAYEWNVFHKLVLGSDWPFTDPAETIASLRNFNTFPREHHLPEVPDELFEEIVQRNTLKILGLG